MLVTRPIIALVVFAPLSASAEARVWAPAVEPKPLSKEVRKGLSWLAEHQLPNGGWGQGEESVQMGGSLDAYKDKGNVADTCIATLALIRAGSTPSSGDHQKQILKGLEFVMKEIEASDADSLKVTNIEGTRVQSKIGPYVDTFMSSLVLAEAKGKMPDDKSEKRLVAALDKVLRKIEKNQQANGTWGGQAWAPVLSQALGSKGLNRAAQAGAPVAESTLDKSEEYARGQFDGNEFADEGSAGVNLYGAAASTGALRDSANTRTQEQAKLELEAKSKDEKVAHEAKKKLKAGEVARNAHASAENALIARLSDPAFVSGFGSNGGEEFLSYMLVSESLVVKGGAEWDKWDTAMTHNLNRVQNGDGSWTGHHCITGRTFVTSSALLVLTADRAPVPIAAQMGRR
jgi:hypothetical protein